MAEVVSTAISPAEPARSEESPEVKSKSRRKQGRLNSKQRFKEVASEVRETSVDSSAAPNPTVSNPITTAASLASTTYEKDPIFLMMASGQIESAEVR